MMVNYFGPRPTALSSDALTNGQTGMQAGQDQVNRASNEIARQPLYQHQNAEFRDSELVSTPANQPATDASGLQVSNVTRELINLSEGELVFKANARSIEAAASMFDSLLAIGRESQDSRSAAEAR